MMFSTRFWILASIYAVSVQAATRELPLPACGEIAVSMCDTARVRAHCKELCAGGSANVNSNTNTNVNNANTNTNTNTNTNVNANVNANANSGNSVETTLGEPSTSAVVTTTAAQPNKPSVGTTRRSGKSNSKSKEHVATGNTEAARRRTTRVTTTVRPIVVNQPSNANAGATVDESEDNGKHKKRHGGKSVKANANAGVDDSTEEDGKRPRHTKHTNKHHTTTSVPAPAPAHAPAPASNSNAARSSGNCNKVDPCVDKGTADAGFLKRCQAAGIAQTCWEKCRYDITFDEMKRAMLSKKCPMDGMREYLKAGANNQDNRSCCEKKGVTEGKRAFCHPFCNPNGSEWPAPNQGAKYLPCASQMNAIMTCHWAGLTA